MTPPTACGICAAPLELRYPGSAGEVTPDDLSPTCHRPGAYGDLYRCTRCGTVQQPTLPAGEQLVDLYRDMRDDAYLGEEAGRRATARRLLGTLGRHAAPGRLLEVGCGPGLLLDEARRLGWEVRGLEPAAAGRRHATDVLGLDVADATLADLRPERDGGLAAIVLVDVIEHLDDPAAALAACAALLAPGGVICVVTPDPDSPTARLAGARWWGYLPAHTYLLPARTLRGLLRGHGLEPVQETGLRRTFTVGYWIGGLGERTRAAQTLSRAIGRLGLAGRPLTLSLGDERVIFARRGSAGPADAAALDAPSVAV